MARSRRTTSRKTGKQVKFWATVIATAVREDAPTFYSDYLSPSSSFGICRFVLISDNIFWKQRFYKKGVILNLLLNLLLGFLVV